MKIADQQTRKSIIWLLRRSWNISWPMILIMFFQFAVNLTDVYIAGLLGKIYQASIGVSTQILFVFIIVANAMTMGTVALVSRIFASGDEKNLLIHLNSILRLSLILGIFFSVLASFITPLIISAYNIPEEMRSVSQTLLLIYMAGLIFNYLFITIQGILRSMHMVKRAMLIMGIGAVLNVGLNFIFVFLTPLGFRGIALSTVASIALAMVVGFILLWKYVDFSVPFSWAVIKKVFSIGWPSGMVQVSWQGSSVILFMIIGAMQADTVSILAAFTNGLRIEAAIFMPAFAFSMANAVISGNSLGGGNKKEAFHGALSTAAIALVAVSAITIVIVSIANMLSGWLSHDADVIRYTSSYIYISMISEPFMAWALVLGGALNGAGDTRSVLGSVFIIIWGIRIPLSYFFGILMSLDVVWVWWSMNISMVIHALIISIRFFKKKWLEIHV